VNELGARDSSLHGAAVMRARCTAVMRARSGALLDLTVQTIQTTNINSHNPIKL